MNDTEIENMVRQIVDYFETVVRERMTYLENYAMDLVFIGTTPYFIEVNPFGGDYGAGSALFNWQTDRGILESTGDEPIILRMLWLNKNFDFYFAILYNLIMNPQTGTQTDNYYFDRNFVRSVTNI